jgi:hypothetical protein
MCLRFPFLPALRLPEWLRLSRRSTASKDAEILLLRHQIAVLERHSTTRPKLTWADRASVKRRWAAKSRPNKAGRPRRHPTITRLVLQMARDNENRGYRRITGELAGLGITVAASTVWEILKKHGVDPAPRRSGPSWAQFLRSQAEAIIACDFFTVDLLDGTKAYVMAVVEHATRRILLYPPSLDALLADVGIRTVRSAVRAPRMNAVMERWIGSCRRELLDRTLIWNLPHLRRILPTAHTWHSPARHRTSLYRPKSPISAPSAPESTTEPAV